MNFKAFAGDHRTQLAVGGVAAVAGLVALKKKSSSSAGAGAAATTGASVPAGGYGSDPYSAAQDAYNSIEPQLESLQGEISGLSAGPSSPAPTPPTKKGPQAIGGTKYQIVAGRSKGAVDILQNGKFLGSWFIPKSGQTNVAGGLRIGAAGDKATGAVDVYNSAGKFIGSYQT